MFDEDGDGRPMSLSCHLGILIDKTIDFIFSMDFVLSILAFTLYSLPFLFAGFAMWVAKGCP